MISCTRRIQFCAGHRIMDHESKCAHLHGHNYVVYITAEPNQRLDELGRVVDFSVLKEKIGGWIEEHWDHGFIVYAKDAILNELFKSMAHANSPLPWDQKLYLLPENPTAENIAKHLLVFVCPQMLHGLDIVVTKVRVEETENCSAEASI